MRISQFPKAQKCRASVMEESKIVRAGNDFTASGQAWHKVAHNYIANVPSNPELMAAFYGVEVSDLVEAIDKLAFVADFDASKIAPGTLIVWDYKSGFGEVDPPQRNTQLIAYGLGALRYLRMGLPWDLIEDEDKPERSGLCAEEEVNCDGVIGHPDLFAWNLDENNEITRIELIVIYPRRDGWTEKAVFDAKTFGEWGNALEQIARECRSENPEYRVGEHCSKCDARLTCPAVNRAAISYRNPPAFDNFHELDPVEKGFNYETAKAVASVCDEVIKLVKNEVDAGREVRFSDGSVLAKVIKSRDRSIESAYDIWPLVDELPQEAFDSIVSVSVGALEKAYMDGHVERIGPKDRAKKGENERVKKEFNQRAEALGMKRVEKYQYRALLPAEIVGEKLEDMGL